MGEFLKKCCRCCDWRQIIRVVVAFSPAILLGILVAKNAVNVPVWDGWERVALFEKYDNGTLSFADFYAPHIDHRMIFPRLAWLGLGIVSDGDLRFEVALTFLVGLLAGIGFWKLARLTLGSENWTMGLAFLANLWIFSPIQYDNWLWPIQTAFMIPITCLVWAIYFTVRSDWKWWTRLLATLALAIVGTHSFSHGLFIWPAVAMLAAISAAANWRQKLHRFYFLSVWIVVAAFIIGCYFTIEFKTGTEYSYGRGFGGAPPISTEVKKNLNVNLEKSGRFFTRMLGAPLVRQFAVDPLPPAARTGIGVLLAYGIFGIVSLIFVFKKTDAKRQRLWPHFLPWLTLGGTVVAIALGVALGRSSLLAEARATVPRLGSVALYLLLSLLVMTVLAAKHFRPAWISKRAWLGPSVLAFLIALQIQPWIYGSKLMELWRISRVQAQAQLMFIEHYDPVPSRVLAYTSDIVKDYAPVLNEKDWLDWPLVKSLELSQFRISENPLPPSKGQILTAEKAENGRLILKGTALIHQPTRPADAVLITAEWEGRDTPKIIGLANFDGTMMPTRYRIDLQFTVLKELLMNEPGSWMRWRESVDLNSLPKNKGPVTLRAWSLNLDMRKVYPARQRVIVKNRGAEIEWVD